MQKGCGQEMQTRNVVKKVAGENVKIPGRRGNRFVFSLWLVVSSSSKHKVTLERGRF